MDEETGLAVRAKAGNMAVFWTRAPPNAGIDPRSWHGGEAVFHGSSEEKWLLRKFKEIPAKTYHDPQARADFVARSHARALSGERTDHKSEPASVAVS